MFHKKHLFTIHVCVIILYYSIVLVVGVDVDVDVGIDTSIDTGVDTGVLILL